MDGAELTISFTPTEFPLPRKSHNSSAENSFNKESELNGILSVVSHALRRALCPEVRETASVELNDLFSSLDN
jgi:hypothetical protein